METGAAGNRDIRYTTDIIRQALSRANDERIKITPAFEKMKFQDLLGTV